MNKKNKKAFTLLEILIAITIASILLFIATDKFIISAFKANSMHNQNIDLQNGVKTSVDNVKNILKKSVQVHLVGKEVYEPNMNLNNLDNRYNYIAFREDEKGNVFLSNIVYNTNKKEFDVIPLTASQKTDILNNNDIKYSLEFYKGDTKYKDKLKKDMLNFTVKGVSKAAYESNQVFELTENLNLPNVNQILISRHLQGGLKDITAIAYDNGIIQPGQQGSGKVSIVFIIDASQSMQCTLDGWIPETVSADDEENFVFMETYGKDSNGIEWSWSNHKGGAEIYYDNNERITATLKELLNPEYEYTTRRVIAQSAINDNFLKQLNKVAKEKNIDIDAYIYKYDTYLMHNDISNKDSDSAKYLYDINDLRANKYGPYKIRDDDEVKRAQEHVTKNCDMKFVANEYNRKDDGWFTFSTSTNTGAALLQGLEILKQLENEGVKNRFLVLLTDGVPTVYNANNIHNDYGNPFISSREVYNNLMKKGELKGVNEYFDGDVAKKYIKEITDPLNKNNTLGLYNKAYLVGFSKQDYDKSLLGFPDENGYVSDDSLYSCMKRSGNPVELYDSKDKNTLDDALNNIVKDIGVNLEIFDGPDKRKDYKK